MWVVELELRRSPADTFLDLPNTLASSPLFSEKHNIVGVCLWIIGEDQTQERGLARTVRAEKRPSLPFADGPIDIAENLHTAVGNVDIFHLHQNSTVALPPFVDFGNMRSRLPEPSISLRVPYDTDPSSSIRRICVTPAGIIVASAAT